MNLCHRSLVKAWKGPVHTLSAINFPTKHVGTYYRIQSWIMELKRHYFYFKFPSQVAGYFITICLILSSSEAAVSPALVATARAVVASGPNLSLTWRAASYLSRCSVRVTCRKLDQISKVCLASPSILPSWHPAQTFIVSPVPLGPTYWSPYLSSFWEHRFPVSATSGSNTELAQNRY